MFCDPGAGALAREALWALVPCHATPPAVSLLRRLAREVRRIVIVDDGLTVGGRAELDASAALVGASVVRAGEGRGKGSAVVAGLHAARTAGATAVIVVDSDGQHPPEAIPAFRRAAASADLVVGDRFRQLHRFPWERRVANLTACAAMRAVTGHPVRDTQCGMRLLRGRALTEMPPGPGGFEAETRHLRRCLRAGIAVSWVPIPAIYEGETSAYRAFSDSARIVAAMLA
jgi:hypothetical protein